MHKKNPTKPKQRPQLPLLPTPLSHPWWVPLKIYTDPGTYFARVQAATAKVKSLTCSCSPINANDTTVKSYGKRSRSQGRKSYLKLELKGDLNVIIILSNQTLWMFALVAISLPRRKMHRWSCSQSHRACTANHGDIFRAAGDPLYLQHDVGLLYLWYLQQFEIKYIYYIYI